MGGGIFQEIVLEWKGQAFKIPADSALKAIAVVEDQISLAELGAAQANPGSIKFTRLAAAYGAVLRFAGAEISDEEVYGGLFTTKDAKRGAASAIVGLLLMMVPETVRDAAAKEVTDLEQQAKATVKNGNRRSRRAAASSRSTTARSSAATG